MPREAIRNKIIVFTGNVDIFTLPLGGRVALHWRTDTESGYVLYAPNDEGMQQ